MSVVGRPPTLQEETLRKASADLLTNREERAKEIRATLVAQIAIIASFLGGFSLLGEPAKSLVLQQDTAFFALVFAAVGFVLAIASYFAPPWTMPDLDNLTDLRNYWNDRITHTRYVLMASMLAIAIGITFALVAFSNGVTDADPAPSASLTGKVTKAAAGPNSFQATVNWIGLGKDAVVRVHVCGVGKAVLGVARTDADRDGKASVDLTGLVTEGEGTWVSVITTVDESGVSSPCVERPVADHLAELKLTATGAGLPR